MRECLSVEDDTFPLPRASSPRSGKTLSDEKDCLERQLQDKALDDPARKVIEKELADVKVKLSAGSAVGGESLGS